MFISKNGSINGEQEVAHLEQSLNIVLPTEYKAFLTKYNGGDTPNTEYRSEKTTFSIRGFYSSENIIKQMDYLFMTDMLNRKMIPIAYDSFGNIIAIGYGKFQDGCVYFCDHELGYKAIQVGAGFNDFISLCNSEPIKDKVYTSVEERERELIARGKGHVINEALKNAWQREIDKYTGMHLEKVRI